MKVLHWIIFSIASWLVLLPIIGDDLLQLIAPNNSPSIEEILHYVQWNDFFLGLIIIVLSLLILTVEAVSKKTPGLRAMHWLQFFIAVYITIIPFLFEFTEETAIWSHVVSGGFIAIFSILQIFLEPSP